MAIAWSEAVVCQMGERLAREQHVAPVAHRHDADSDMHLDQLRLVSSNKRQLQPLAGDVHGYRIVDPCAEVVIAGVVPNVGQYL